MPTLQYMHRRSNQLALSTVYGLGNMAKKTKVPGKKRLANERSQPDDLKTSNQEISSLSASSRTSRAVWSTNAAWCSGAAVVILAFLLRNISTKGGNEETMIEWIRNNGGFVHANVTIRNADNNGRRGVFVDADLQPDEMILVVPEACFFSIKTLREGKALFSKVMKEDPALVEAEIQPVQLAMALMAENRSKHSFWRPYIDLLPKSHPDQPLFWDETQLQELQSPIVLSQIQQSKRFLKNKLPLLRAMASRLAPLRFPDNDEELLADFILAYYTVISRSFEVPGKRDSQGNPDSEDFVGGMVPYADLLNHEFGEPTAKSSFNIAMPKRIIQYIFSAVKYLPANSELVFKYHLASKATTRNLLRYGMVDSDLERAEADYILLRSTDRQWIVKYDGSIVGWINEDGDDLARELLPKVESAIQSLPTSLKEDESILSSSDDAFMRSALLFRMRYKRILHKLLARLQSGAAHSHEQGDELDFSPSLALIQIDIS